MKHIQDKDGQSRQPGIGTKPALPPTNENVSFFCWGCLQAAGTNTYDNCRRSKPEDITLVVEKGEAFMTDQGGATAPLPEGVFLPSILIHKLEGIPNGDD